VAAAADCRLHVVLLGERAMRDLNYRFKGSRRLTDVLAFDLRAATNETAGFGSSDEPDCVLGEIYVSPEAAIRAAGDEGTSIGFEMLLYIVHGMLHLAGLRDDTPAHRCRMREAEQRVMAELKPATGDFDRFFRIAKEI
jgi:probable rRNA maturation factor